MPVALLPPSPHVSHVMPLLKSAGIFSANHGGKEGHYFSDIPKLLFFCFRSYVFGYFSLLPSPIPAFLQASIEITTTAKGGAAQLFLQVIVGSGGAGRGGGESGRHRQRQINGRNKPRNNEVVHYFIKSRVNNERYSKTYFIIPDLSMPFAFQNEGGGSREEVGEGEEEERTRTSDNPTRREEGERPLLTPNQRRRRNIRPTNQPAPVLRIV